MKDLNKAGGILLPLHGKRGQLQTGNPAFGAGFQSGDIFRRETKTHRLVEKLGGFGGGKAQIGGAQLGQLAAGTQPGQGEMRIFTGGDDQVHLRRYMFEQKGESVIDRSGLDYMIIVENQDKIIRDGGDLVEQGRQNCFGRRRLGRLERA